MGDYQCALLGILSVAYVQRGFSMELAAPGVTTQPGLHPSKFSNLGLGSTQAV